MVSNFSASKRKKFSWRLLYSFHFFKKHTEKLYPNYPSRHDRIFSYLLAETFAVHSKRGCHGYVGQSLGGTMVSEKNAVMSKLDQFRVTMMSYYEKKASVIVGRPLNLKVKCRLRTYLLPFSRNLKIFSFTSESIFGASRDLHEISIPQFPFVYQLPDVFCLLFIFGSRSFFKSI